MGSNKKMVTGKAQK